MSRPTYRAAWTLIDKILNKTLDYDARILHPESSSSLTLRLDRTIRRTLTEIVQVTELSEIEYQYMCLDTTRGGCGITTTVQKSSFTHLAAACQYFPAITQTLVDMEWSKDEVEETINFAGVNSV